MLYIADDNDNVTEDADIVHRLLHTHALDNISTLSLLSIRLQGPTLFLRKKQTFTIVYNLLKTYKSKPPLSHHLLAVVTPKQIALEIVCKLRNPRYSSPAYRCSTPPCHLQERGTAFQPSCGSQGTGPGRKNSLLQIVQNLLDVRQVFLVRCLPYLIRKIAHSISPLQWGQAGHTIVKKLKCLRNSSSDLFICKIQLQKHFAKQLF